MVNNVNKKDILILSELRKNSRATLTKLSRDTKIPISTIFDKLRNHESNLIHKHTCLVDFATLGFNTKAQIMIKVGKESREGIKDYLAKNMNVNSVFKINNGYDYAVECIFKHIKELEEFIEDIELKFEIIERQVYYVIEDIIREKFMSDRQLLTYLFN